MAHEMSGDHESFLSKNQKKMKQDKKIPFLINIHDGRLIPNVENTATQANYRPYHGPVDAPLEARMRYIQSVSAVRRIIDSSAIDDDAQPVDIGAMSKEELIAFAFDDLGLGLDPKEDIRTMRKKVIAAAEAKAAAASAAATEGGDDIAG